MPFPHTMRRKSTSFGTVIKNLKGFNARDQKQLITMEQTAHVTKYIHNFLLLQTLQYNLSQLWLHVVQFKSYIKNVKHILNKSHIKSVKHTLKVILRSVRHILNVY